VADLLANIEALPPLREIIREHELRAEKSLGQNFLLDLNVTDKIARHALAHNKNLDALTVFEIGPGPGGLTRSLLKMQPKKVVAIEFDPRAVAALQSLKDASNGRLEVLQADALDTDLTALSAGPRAIVANLPYNIATPLLIGWLRQIYDDPAHFSSMTLMFQKEVAQRIAANVGDKAYGRLAVLTGWLCRAKIAFDLPASAFVPPPKVKSAIVQLTPKERADNADFATLERITAAAFGQRRKMLRSSLREYEAHFDACGIDPQIRAENLDVASYVTLAQKVGQTI